MSVCGSEQHMWHVFFFFFSSCGFKKPVLLSKSSTWVSEYFCKRRKDVMVGIARTQIHFPPSPAHYLLTLGIMNH